MVVCQYVYQEGISMNFDIKKLLLIAVIASSQVALGMNEVQGTPNGTVVQDEGVQVDFSVDKDNPYLLDMIDNQADKPAATSLIEVQQKEINVDYDFTLRDLMQGTAAFGAVTMWTMPRVAKFGLFVGAVKLANYALRENKKYQDIKAQGKVLLNDCKAQGKVLLNGYKEKAKVAFNDFMVNAPEMVHVER